MCSEYPLIYGILYLQRGNLRKKALKYLKNGQVGRAFIYLLYIRKILWLPVFILLLPNIVNSFVNKISGRDIYKILGFEKVTDFLTLFSYSRTWSSYIKNRERMPSYFTSLTLTNLIKNRSYKAIDVGCGTGQLLRDLAEKTNPQNIYGIDTSFMNLLLARRFYASPDSLLICVDVDKGLPFERGSIDLVLSVDSFHYLKEKGFFLKESSRVLKDTGAVAALHIVNSRRVVFGNVRGVTPRKLSGLLKKTGFEKPMFISNANLWTSVNRNKPIILDSSWDWNELDNSFAYNFLAGKRRLKGTLSLSPFQFKKLKNTKIDYTKDKTSLNDLALSKVIDKYDKFLFLSPHLDDAVLSCGLLLEKLVVLGKKVVVASLFTKVSTPPFTQNASLFIQKSGYKKAEELFEDRIKEDIKALKFLKVRYRYFDYIDAAFRKSQLFEKFPNMGFLLKLFPQFVHIYTNPKREFSGRVSFQDRGLVWGIKKDLKRFIKKLGDEKILILAPLGVGGHVDHIIVRDFARKSGLDVLYWLDFPYSTKKEYIKTYFSKEWQYEKCLEIEVPLKTKKYQAIKSYKSQIDVLFPRRKIAQIKEVYYVLGESRI